MSPPRSSRRAQRGVTLIELIVSIVILTTAGIALASTLGYISSRSGDTLGEMQAQAVADAYLSNELAKPFGALANSNAPEGSLQVSVVVANSGALVNIPAGSARRVDVTVTTPSGGRVVATGYRVQYP
jgi:prepilin-type N-terminal cleavage/methylation domain-containing protein